MHLLRANILRDFVGVRATFTTEPSLLTVGVTAEPNELFSLWAGKVSTSEVPQYWAMMQQTFKIELAHARGGGIWEELGCVSWDYCIAGPILDREMWGTYSVDFCGSTSCPTWSGKGLWNRVWSKDPSSISSPTNPRLVHKFCLSCLPPGLQDRFQIWVTWSYTGNYLTVLSLQDVS